MAVKIGWDKQRRLRLAGQAGRTGQGRISLIGHCRHVSKGRAEKPVRQAGQCRAEQNRQASQSRAAQAIPAGSPKTLDKVGQEEQSRQAG